MINTFKLCFFYLQINLAADTPKIVFDTKIDNCHFDFIYNEIIDWQSHFKGLNINSEEDAINEQLVLVGNLYAIVISYFIEVNLVFRLSLKSCCISTLGTLVSITWFRRQHKQIFQ